MSVHFIFVSFSVFIHSWAVAVTNLAWIRCWGEMFKATQKTILQPSILLSIVFCIAQCIWMKAWMLGRFRSVLRRWLLWTGGSRSMLFSGFKLCAPWWEGIRLMRPQTERQCFTNEVSWLKKCLAQLLHFLDFCLVIQNVGLGRLGHRQLAKMSALFVLQNQSFLCVFN